MNILNTLFTTKPEAQRPLTALFHILAVPPRSRGNPVDQVTCADGTKLSVQASRGHYCIPRDDRGPYTHVEVMGDGPWHWLKYLDGEGPRLIFSFKRRRLYYDPGWDGVYGYVPYQKVAAFIIRHSGGLALRPNVRSILASAAMILAVIGLV